MENERKREVKKLQHLIKGGRGTETIWKKNRIYIGECISAIPGCLKLLARIQMYLAEQKEEKGKKREQKGGDNVSEEKHIKYYMTEHGQIFKFDRTKFISCELDLQNMVWFQNQDFTGIYFGEYIKYTELEGFEDCYEERKSI